MTQTASRTRTAVKVLEEKKAENISIIDISGVSILADHFVIASGSNKKHVKALADSVEEALGKEGIAPKSIEGYHTGSWILIDYGDLVVHIFDKKSWEFYDLERIWKDGKKITVADLDSMAESLVQEEHSA